MALKNTTQKNPFDVIVRRHISEKAITLQELHSAESNRSLARCKTPKYVFIIRPDATKQDVKRAVEEIYKEQNVKVVSVNTINVKSKRTRRVRKGGFGRKAAFKKAVVTLEEGDTLDAV